MKLQIIRFLTTIQPQYIFGFIEIIIMILIIKNLKELIYKRNNKG